MMDIDKEMLLDLYTKMRTIRAFEEKVAELFAAGKIPGFVHLCTGQEAVAAGVCAHLRADDYIVSTHRGHGHMIAKGADNRLMMAELYGRTDGYCKGKGGSMHICDFDKGVLGANGIVGGGLPIANGAAFSSKYRGTDQVVVCFFGDGATNQGTFHESLNLAALWKLPVVFVCENNGWAEFTSQMDSMYIEKISKRAESYGMQGQTIDGTDVFSVIEFARDAIKGARAEKGPTLLEFMTFRFRGHYEGDPQKYRPEEEQIKAKSRDPIEIFMNRVLREQLLDRGEIERIDQEITKKLEEAVMFAENSSFPEFDKEPEKAYA